MPRIGWRGHAIIGFALPVPMAARIQFRGWGVWIDGAFYFGTARSSRKARNLAQNPAVSVHLNSGDEVVILEGTVVEVSHNERAALKKLDAASGAKYKMPLTAIPGETVLYRVQLRVVLAWTEKAFPKNATRGQLSSAASSE
jgi:pyridoxine/pyridoxamine 5'-phosphate oxidase